LREAEGGGAALQRTSLQTVQTGLLMLSNGPPKLVTSLPMLLTAMSLPRQGGAG
jgi:hypothetical protein